MRDVTGYYISGSFQQRSILVKKFTKFKDNGESSYAVNDIVVTVLMNNHKNVLKILGCCLDLEIPAIIYEIENNYELLYDILIRRTKDGNFWNNIGRSLSWSNRLKIARDVANALVYLHTAFLTPIIHRGMTARRIVIDNNGVAKLVDFSVSVTLPPGESQVEVKLPSKLRYYEPDYVATGIITEKTDVFSMGIILLQLLTALDFWFQHTEGPENIVEYIQNHVDKNELSKILDPIILEESGEIEHQLQALLRLALRCTAERGADRPDIIDVAKELVRIQRNYEVQVLPIVNSDHNPLFINCCSGYSNRGFCPPKLFRYEVVWSRKQECKDLIERAWSIPRGAEQAISSV
ncbi:unnamed protein product [Fraxinus pennsylvanica]|uniref:Protein kinase domain-containing protein n=1 Tax=Fraxinus pennsylvanica TaxID=56036 RepID=A0AAD2E9A9_9LAMI|nr:unnamed protein product [Fraxinus pennsylvanica]